MNAERGMLNSKYTRRTGVGPSFIVHRYAFTLIELLIAIGIIVLLAGMVILGMRSVMGQSKTNATRITLQTLQSMLAEYEAKTRLSSTPPAWRWYESGASSVTIVPPGASPYGTPYDYDFWKIPFRSAAVTYRNPDALDAPGLVADTDPVTRNGCRQVLNTQIVMARLLALPANRAALEKIPADRYFTPRWVGGSGAPLGGKVATPGNDGVLMTNNEGTEDVYYLTGAKVEATTGRFRCKLDHASTGSTPPPGSNWDPDSSPASPLLLDAWNNPIIFVPGTGLRVRLLNGKSANDPTDKQQTFIIVSPEGKTDRLGTGEPYVVQPGRPFFASAGPDGNFATGDDNIYSFEQ